MSTSSSSRDVPDGSVVTAGSAAISCRGLVKRYGEVMAVDALDLEVRAGECFGLLGPNGAGKTTTIEILQGLLAADAGVVQVLGLTWERHEDELRQRMGSQLQETKLAEKLTVRETLTLFRSFYRRGASPDQVMGVVQLTEKQNAWVSKLSGGQRQRVGVARALAARPRVMLMDEPFGALDAQTRIVVETEFLEIWQKLRKSVVFITHDIEEAVSLSDRVLVMTHRPGTIKCEISVDLPRPRDFYEIRFEKSFRDLARQVWEALRFEVDELATT